MNILITGADGFVGKNLVASLESVRDGKDKTRPELKIDEIYKYDVNSNEDELVTYCKKADFVLHLAGVNRPINEDEFTKGNRDFTEKLLNILREVNNNCTVCLSSSIQAENGSAYGQSKLEAENLVRKHGAETGAKVLVYRFPNLFGKWSRQNYNTVVATFCYNIARGAQIKISDPDKIINLVYIDDVVNELIDALLDREHRDDGEFCVIPVSYSVSLSEIALRIYSFRDSRKLRAVPEIRDDFGRKLYATYLSFLPEDSFAYDLEMKADERGGFTEFLRSDGCGQMSVNVIKPGVVKGQHWHHTKNEKFLVVHGNGVVRFRDIHSDKVLEYYVNGDRLQVVDIPCGYTHNIENLGEKEMIVLMWASECFDSEKPDTYYLEV